MKDFIDELRLKKFIKEEKKTDTWVVVLAIIGVVVLIAAAVYAAYRFFAPKALDEFEDEFEDEFDDDFFVEEEEVVADDVFAEE